MQGEPAGPRSSPLAFPELSLFRCACHEHGVASVLVASVAWLLASLPGCPSLRALLPALPERVLPFGHRHTPRLAHQSTCLLPFFRWFLTIFFLVLCYLNFSTPSTFKLKKKERNLQHTHFKCDIHKPFAPVPALCNQFRASPGASRVTVRRAQTWLSGSLMDRDGQPGALLGAQGPAGMPRLRLPSAAHQAHARPAALRAHPTRRCF